MRCSTAPARWRALSFGWPSPSPGAAQSGAGDRMGRRTRPVPGPRREAAWGACLPESPPRSQHRPPQVVVARGGLAELHQQQVHQRRQLNRRRQLERVVLELGPEAASVEVDRDLGDRPAVQVAALDLGDRDPLDEVVEELRWLILLDEGRVAEDARVVERKSWGGTDWAIHWRGGVLGLV